MDFSTLLNNEVLTFQAPNFSLIVLVQKLGLATILGIFLSFVASWTYTGDRKAKKISKTLLAMQHTHILVCLSSAFVMIIIGNSLANAFALTGALSMVRFRTNLIDPKEASIIILFIAVGMACGLGLPNTASIMSGLIGLMLGGMYWQHQRLHKRLEARTAVLKIPNEDEIKEIN